MRYIRLAAAGLILTTAFPAATRDRGVYTGGKQCISLQSIRAKSAESNSRLILHVGGSSAYINHLPQPCDNLMAVNNVAHVKLQPRGDRLCAGDTILVSDDSILSVVGAGDKDGATSCTLGNFEPVSEMTLSEDLRR